jgi:hypothetical protein
MAEGVGFEPTDPFESTVFKTAAFDHSANPPQIFIIVKPQGVVNVSQFQTTT